MEIAEVKKGLFNLSEEDTEILRRMKPDIITAQEKLDLMKEIGLDVTVLQEKLNWAARVQAIIAKTKGA